MKNNMVNILLVEDDEVDIMHVQRAFKKVNIAHPLSVAHDGEEALSMLCEEGRSAINPRPRIILLDLNMPKMNGIDFLRQLRANPTLQEILVFVCTTSNHEDDKLAAYKLNVAGYILKPMQPQKFIEAISMLNHYWSLIEMP